MTGRVVTITEDWLATIIQERLYKKTTEFCYWTNGWIPKQQITTLEVYFENKLMIRGRVCDYYKKSPYDIFSDYKNSLGSIGLPDNSQFSDFNKLLTVPFKNVPQILGNIIFTIDAINQDILRNIKTIPNNCNIQSIPTIIRIINGKIEYN